MGLITVLQILMLVILISLALCYDPFYIPVVFYGALQPIYLWLLLYCWTYVFKLLHFFQANPTNVSCQIPSPPPIYSFSLKTECHFVDFLLGIFGVCQHRQHMLPDWYWFCLVISDLIIIPRHECVKILWIKVSTKSTIPHISTYVALRRL